MANQLGPLQPQPKSSASSRPPSFEEPSTSAAQGAARSTLTSPPPLLQSPPLQRGEWKRMIQESSLPPSARMDTGARCAPAARRASTSAAPKANACSPSPSTHVSKLNRQPDAVTQKKRPRTDSEDEGDTRTLTTTEDQPARSRSKRARTSTTLVEGLTPDLLVSRMTTQWRETYGKLAARSYAGLTSGQAASNRPLTVDERY